jgi:hypothetical protein
MPARPTNPVIGDIIRGQTQVAFELHTTGGIRAASGAGGVQLELVSDPRERPPGRARSQVDRGNSGFQPVARTRDVWGR